MDDIERMGRDMERGSGVERDMEREREWLGDTEGEREPQRIFLNKYLKHLHTNSVLAITDQFKIHLAIDNTMHISMFGHI